MRPMPELKVVEIPTEELVEYENNAKLHPHEQIDQIANSISEFGFNSPILAWHNDEGEPEIVAGHGRLMAAKKLGMDKLPVVFLDHMNEEQRRAYILVDNKLTMNSDFDFEILADELANIETLDMSELGFDVFELAEAATEVDDFVPRSDEIKAYSENGESELRSYNVVICCLDESEQEWLAELLHEESKLKRLYMCSEIKERADA